MSPVERLVTASWFRSFILAVIVVNSIVLGLQTSGRATEAAGGLLSVLDGLCLAIFVVEIALKLIAWRGSFFRGGWNVFDFLVVAASLIPGGQSLSVLRALRVLRVLRLLSTLPSLRSVVDALVRALPGMASVIILLGIIFYAGSVMATSLYGAAFPEWFGTIGGSAYSLFQIMTLESWSMGIVRPVMEVYPSAWAFFVPFIISTSFAVMNLFVGLVVNAMQEGQEAAKAPEEEREAEEETLFRSQVLDRLTEIERALGK